jgi:hypothetical protein
MTLTATMQLDLWFQAKTAIRLLQMNKQLLVASTDAAPVNCLKVNILFSAIGDFTDTVILA